MANISSAYGTLALVGDWPEEAITLANQVVKSWAFHGEYGLSMWDDFSFEQEEIEFSGSGRCFAMGAGCWARRCSIR